MNCTHNRLIAGADIETADARTRATLAERGIGVLTEIDVKATLECKIGEEIDRTGAPTTSEGVRRTRYG